MHLLGISTLRALQFETLRWAGCGGRGAYGSLFKMWHGKCVHEEFIISPGGNFSHLGFAADNLQSSFLDAFQDTFRDCHAIGNHSSHNGYGAFSNESGLHPDAWDMIGKSYTRKTIQLVTSRTEKHPVSFTTTET